MRKKEKRMKMMLLYQEEKRERETGCRENITRGAQVYVRSFDIMSRGTLINWLAGRATGDYVASGNGLPRVNLPRMVSLLNEFECVPSDDA